jgi:hypothetical protein
MLISITVHGHCIADWTVFSALLRWFSFIPYHGFFIKLKVINICRIVCGGARKEESVIQDCDRVLCMGSVVCGERVVDV